jgi:pyridoxamine 5'-phosphate oxidase
MSTPQDPILELNRDQIRAMRRSYGEFGLAESDVAADPINQFQLWLSEAAQNPMIVEPNAMVLSTVDEVGPQSRTVLLKDVGADGFSFFTNYGSNKARAIAQNPQVSLLFPWYAMERQVIVRGSAEKVSERASADYFATRPWGSQIGAWASSQSHDLESREHLQARYDEFAERYPEGTPVPLPPHWGGYLVVPRGIEFWQGRYSRLHDRLLYTSTASGWKITRLHP